MYVWTCVHTEDIKKLISIYIHTYTHTYIHTYAFKWVCGVSACACKCFYERNFGGRPFPWKCCSIFSLGKARCTLFHTKASPLTLEPYQPSVRTALQTLPLSLFLSDRPCINSGCFLSFNNPVNTAKATGSWSLELVSQPLALRKLVNIGLVLNRMHFKPGPPKRHQILCFDQAMPITSQ